MTLHDILGGIIVPTVTTHVENQVMNIAKHLFYAFTSIRYTSQVS